MGEFKMQASPNKYQKVVWTSLLLAVAYWLVETIRFSNFFTEVDFIQALFNPGLFDLSARVLVVLLIIWFARYANRIIKQRTCENQALQELLESKDYTLATASVPIVILNETLQITNINKATAVLTGTKAEDLINNNVLNALFYRDDREKIEKALLSNPNKTDPSIGIVKLRVKHKKDCWITFTTATESDKEKITQIYLLLNDVSSLASGLATTEYTLSTLNEKTKAQETEIETLQTSLETELQLKAELESEIQLLAEQQTEHEEKMVKTQSEVVELAKQRTNLEQQLVAKQTEFDAIDQKHRLLQEKYQALATQQQADILDNQTLRQELKNIQMQTEKMPLPLLKLDFHGTVQSLNPAANKLLGFKTGDHLINYISSREQKDIFNSLINRFKQGEVAVSSELRFTIEQEDIVLFCHGVSLAETKQILIYGYDITPFQLTTRELATTLDNNRFEVNELIKEMEMKRDRTSAVLNSIDEGIIITDLYNRITMMNPAAEDMLGIRLSQVLERPIHFVLREPVLLEQIRKTLLEGLLNNKFQLETHVLNNNQPLTLDIKTVVIRNKYFHEEGVLLRVKNHN